MNYNKKVLILGLGYVGLTLGLVFAKNGINVFGYDINKSTIKSLKLKKPTFFEKNIKTYIKKYINKSFKLLDQIEAADIYIITVGTPLKKNSKEPEIDYLKKSIISISSKIKKNDLIILRSTVPIGITRKLAIPIIEKNSHLKVGVDFKISFCPERTVEGNALYELETLPQIIGGFDKKSFNDSKKLFIKNTSQIINAETLEGAEMCKLLDNTYRDTIFAYSNQMAKLSEKLNLNLHNLIEKVNYKYERNSIPRPSPGVGGPCLTKDPYILDDVFKKNSLKSEIILNSRKINESMILHMYNRCKSFLSSRGKNISKSKIFILGIAFKGTPPTGDTRFSTSLDLIDLFNLKKITNIYAYDFDVSKDDFNLLKLNYTSIQTGFKNSDCVIIMNEHSYYKKLQINKLLNTMKKNSLLFDSWGIFRNNQKIKNRKDIGYMGVGF